jgi:hypothetical protein
MNIFFYLILSFIYDSVHANINPNYHDLSNEPVGIEKLNPGINLEEACSHYIDCYNCTVARCYWSDN